MLEALRHNPDGVSVVLHASHSDIYSPVLAAADVSEVEPSICGGSYVDWALEFCQRHAIEFFLPCHEILAIMQREQEFTTAGVRVLASSATAVALLADKVATYRAAHTSGIPVPPWRSAVGSAAFEQAVAELRSELLPGEQLCIKPAVGVGGKGFRILDERAYGLDDLLDDPSPRVHPKTVVAALRDAEAHGRDVPALLVLPYLDEPEISVDTLSDRGRVLALVPRRKQGRRQVLGADERVLDLAERVVTGFGLSYLANTQLRTWRGSPVLLEVNTRISGGLFQSALAEVNLPWAALRIAAGEPVLRMRPVFGASCVTVPMPVVPDPVVGRLPSARRGSKDVSTGG